MAPKSGPTHAQKLEMILTWFRNSRTCHTQKDLEDKLPKVASINKMIVKDVIKELMDESKIRMEKIGSMNWFWCWAGEEAKEKNRVIGQLEVEIVKISDSNTELSSRLTSLKEERTAAQTDPAHQQLTQQLGPLEDEVKALSTEKDEWENAVAGGTQSLHEEAERMKAETSMATDNIYVLESYLQMRAGGDRNTMESIRMEVYGRLYVEGEGLEELEGI